MKKISSFIACCVLGVSASSAWCDTIAIRPADAPPTAPAQTYANVKVNGVDDGKIKFVTDSGNTVSKDFATVVGMTLDDEPNFNDAEKAFNDGKYDSAANKYSQTINKTDKAWLKDYCVTKLADAANKAGLFDKAVDSFILLVQKNPALAATHKPTVPAAGSSYLDGAARTLTAAADASGIKPQQQEMLLDLLLEVQQARKDDAAVDAVAKRLSKSASSSVGPRAPANAGAIADAKLAEIHSAIDQKKYDDAAQLIKDSGAMFTDPQKQADALWMLAQARDGQAAAKDSDPNGWKDAAIAYMRVVANFKDLPNKPHVADSLMRTAAILEKLTLNKEAMETYLSVAKDFPGTPQASKAQQEADRLKPAKPS